MPRYKAAFEDGTIEIPKDADVLADHRAIVLEQGIAKISERRTGSDGKGRHGDSAMAASLAFFASRAEVARSHTFRRAGLGKREWFEGRGNPFGSAPVEDEMVGGRARGF